MSAPLTFVRRGPAARREPGRRPGAGPARVGPRDQRDQHRRPSRADPRPVPRPPGVPDLLRPDPGRCRATILTRILQAVFPVCAGINLEYYFSYVDNAGWGCGTKLPHNITALLGVMDGAASDLRTACPGRWSRSTSRSVALRHRDDARGDAADHGTQRGIGRLCRNGWVRLAVLHPETRELSVFQAAISRVSAPGRVLPRAASSVDWYRGWRDHLEFAEIGMRSGPPQ